MRLPAIRGVIDRRILANFRVDPQAMSNVLPSPFRPKLHRGFAIGGICLIRLKRVRPKFLPIPWGIGSENGAHRIAVEWDDNGKVKEGVYIPRRDTSSLLNSLAGGRIFPGEHHRAKFNVIETEESMHVEMISEDGKSNVKVVGKIDLDIPDGSAFQSVEEASSFFEQGSLGYSATANGETFDGLELRCRTWSVKPLNVSCVESGFFQDANRFPPGSVEYDCTLLMKDIDHEWHSREELCCP